MDFAELGKTVYYYSSENTRLSVESVVDSGVLDLTVKDLGGYKSSGVLTILVTDAKDEYALCTVKIPVEVN